MAEKSKEDKPFYENIIMAGITLHGGNPCGFMNFEDCLEKEIAKERKIRH